MATSTKSTETPTSNTAAATNTNAATTTTTTCTNTTATTITDSSQACNLDKQSDSTYSMHAGQLVTSTSTTASATATATATATAIASKTLHHRLALPAHMELCQIELIYRAEGNANLVLALPQFKKVLRLPKMLPTNRQQQQQQEQQEQHELQLQKQTKQNEKTQQQTAQQQQQTLQNVSDSVRHQNAKVGNLTMKDFVDFIEIIRCLLGNEFIFDAEIIQIPKEMDRKWLNERIRADRPAHRLDKEFCGQFGLLLPDVTQLPAAFDILVSNLQPSVTLSGDTYAIEIKPKQGWLLPNDVNNLFNIKVENSKGATPGPGAAIMQQYETPSKITKITKTNNSRCRYCAMQFLKLQKGKVTKRSSYCPMELFSGNPCRMLAALHALFECPQNNLRIYQNGNLIYGDHYKSISLENLRAQIFTDEMTLPFIKDLIVTCLLRDYDENGCVSGSSRCSPANIVGPSGVGQPHSSATQTQAATSNALVIETKTETEVQATSTQITEAEMLCLPKNCILQKILHLQLLAKQNLHFMHRKGYADMTIKSYNILATLLKKLNEVSFKNLQPEEEYLLAAMAMDCSIMITFQEITTEKILPSSPYIVHMPNSNKVFLTKINLLDLDPKPDSHFSKYVKQTREAYECCNS